MVLKAGAGPGVADPDCIAVTRGTHHVIVPESVPELKVGTLVAGRITGRAVLGGCVMIVIDPETTESGTTAYCSGVS